MDNSERLAEQYLKSCGFSQVQYEPDGNVPPDFLCDGRVAVEVRRLNQNHVSGKETQGLEEVAIPLWQKVQRLAYSLGPPTRGASWYLFYRFQRPVEPWGKLGPKVKIALQNFLDQPEHRKAAFKIGSFEVEIFPTGTPRETFFRMAGTSDQESGGWVLAELEKNLNICIAEKARKISKVRSKYPEWWLVLEDQIAQGLDALDRKQFRESVSLVHNWDKVVLLDPANPLRAFEI